MSLLQFWRFLWPLFLSSVIGIPCLLDPRIGARILGGAIVAIGIVGNILWIRFVSKE